MDQPVVPRLDSIGVAVRKKRSQTSRRPKPEGQPPPHTPPMTSSDENMGDANTGGKMFNLNQCVSRSLPVSGPENGPNVLLGNGMNDGEGSEKRLKKVKLKVGGVTRTIQTKPSSNGASGSGSSLKVNQSSDSTRRRQKLILQESSDEYHSPPMEKKNGLQGIPWKDFSKGKFSIVREDKGKMPAKNVAEQKSDSVRKSKRAPKKRAMDGEFDDDDEDDEIRYLEKLKTSKISGYKNMDLESSRKPRKGDVDYEDGEEPSSDGEHDGKKKKQQKKDISDSPSENKKEMALTTRQRALLTKDASSPSLTSQIEFPNGLPPAPSRKQKEKLTEVEQQLKKAEAAQRRRLQNEKAARESEADAIRKILGQDSSRKKREEKTKKRQEELAQGKATSAEMLATSIIRTVMGPAGTTVTFPQTLGLPKFFDPKPCSYPPAREKCAGPACTNSYKYRDSKSKLPLCSLECYKAINEKMQSEKAW